MRSAPCVDRCRALLDGPVPAYVPIVRGGGKMHVRMLCLGRHWNGKTYRYESTRADYDNLPVPPLPEEFRRLAHEIAASVGMALEPDLCIMNFYDAEGRMGLHQDKDEGERSIAAGVPVVSISLGDTARFLFGGLRRREPVEALLLESGDAFVFGGPSRLRYHGCRESFLQPPPRRSASRAGSISRSASTICRRSSDRHGNHQAITPPAPSRLARRYTRFAATMSSIATPIAL